MAGVVLVCLCLLAAVFNVGIAFGATGAVASTVSASDALWQDARAALNARQYPKARTLFNEFLKKFQTDPRALEAQICIGICDYRQGSVPRAVNTWTHAVNMELLQKRRNPALLLGLEQLAGHWQKQNKRAEHEKTLAQMGELFPDEPATHRAHLTAAAQRFEAGDYAAAAALYARAGALSGRNAENYQLSQELASDTALSVRLLIDKATAYWENDAPEVAARLYEEALKRNPTVVDKQEAMTHLGWCLYLQKDNNRAEKLWRAVLVLLKIHLNSAWSVSLERAKNDDGSLVDHRSSAQKVKIWMQDIKNQRNKQSYALKVNLFSSEYRIIANLRDNGISLEIATITNLLLIMTKEAQKEDFVFLLQSRNKDALRLLEYWRKHPEEISEMPPALDFSKKASGMSDRQLYNTLLKDESALIQYIKTPLAETNQLYFFLIDPSEYPRVSTKDAEETKVP